jgi:NADH pyrophosphatase NudC (nudix superfamily)
MWSLVSGMVEWGETVKEALAREAMEEIGQEIYDIEYTGRYYDKIGRHPTKTVVCLPHRCKIKNYDIKMNHENSESRWFSKSEIREMELAFDHKEMLINEGLL